jgi:lipoprotein-releasing system ATP-binding protein
MTQNGTLLELIDVSKTYPSPEGADAPAVLKGINLAVREGESLAVVGPSGCGKSTLLNIMGTLDRPTSGRVLLGGRDLSEMDDKALAALRSREIGFVFQLHHLLPQCTILLDHVGLSQRLSHRPGQLSGGERQRAAVVRALINSPKLLLADEPTGSLDGATAARLGRLLVELNRDEGVTLVVVTHSLELAGQMGRVMQLRDGTLAETEGAE